MPVKQLAEQDGLTYFLIYASDVQYDPSNAEQAARYKELTRRHRTSQRTISVLDDLTDKDNTARRRQLLEGLGRHYAALHMGGRARPSACTLMRKPTAVKCFSAAPTGKPAIRLTPLTA